MLTYLAGLNLSSREEQTLVLASEGRTDKEIALDMGVSMASVRTYWARIRKKLATSNRAQSLAKVFLLAFEASRQEAPTTPEEVARILEDQGIGMSVSNMDGTILWANDAYLRMLGVSRDELSKGVVSWRELTAPESLALDTDSHEELRSTGMATPYVKEYVRKDGKVVKVRRSAIAIGNDLNINYFVELDSTKSQRRLLL